MVAFLVAVSAAGMQEMTTREMAAVSGSASYVETNARCRDFLALPQGSCCKRFSIVSSARRCAGRIKLLLASAQCESATGEVCVLEEVVCPVYIEYDCIPPPGELLCIAHEDCSLANPRESEAKAPLLICK